MNRLFCFLLSVVILNVWPGYMHAQDIGINEIIESKKHKTVGHIYDDQQRVKLSLYEAITLAMAKNYQVQINRIRTEITDEQVKRSNGRFDPEFSAGYGRESKRSPELGSGALSKERNNDWLTSTNLKGIFPWGTQYSLGLSYSENEQATTSLERGSIGRFYSQIEVVQPLLNGLIANEYSIDQKISKTNVKLQRQVFQENLMNTVRQVVRLYTDLYFAKKNLEAALLSEKRAQKLVSDNQKRAEIGRSAKSDIVVARARLARRHDNVIAARRLLEVQTNNLALIITDNDSYAKTRFAIRDLPPIEPFKRDITKDKKLAIEQRADYQKARVNITQTGLVLRRDRQNLLPKLDLTVRYGQEGFTNRGIFADALEAYGDDDRNTLYTGLSVSMPLSNKRARAQRSISHHRHHIAKLEEKFLRQNVETGIENAFISVLSSWERFENSREALSLAELSLVYEEKKLQVGKSNSFFVLNLQDELASVRIRSIIAETDYFKAIVNYHYDIGNILNYFNIRSQ